MSINIKFVFDSKQNLHLLKKYRSVNPLKDETVSVLFKDSVPTAQLTRSA